MADEPPTTSHVNRVFGIIKRPNDLLREMARHPQLCCFFLTFLVSFIFEYVCSSKGKPVVLPPRPPQFMFPPSGPVKDAPLGTLAPLVQMLQQDDFVVALYYAPWCTKSKAARSEYLKAALFLEGKVQFAAINCWWSEGECRKRYKFLMYPVLMVYHTKLDGYRFSGPFRAEHIVKFVESLMHPVSAVHSKQDIVNLVAKHDTAVFGYFNLSCEAHIGGYRQFYYASMRIIERDPLQPIRLAVVTNSSVANELGMTVYGSIVLFRLTNTSMTYPFGKNITSSNIVNWALYNKGQEVVKRLSPEGVKSKALATEINKGPALILFHVENPLFDTELALNVVKDLALLYNNCKIHPLFKVSRQTLLALAHGAIQKYQQLNRYCQSLKMKPKTDSHQHQQKQLIVCCMSAVVPATNVSSNASGRVCSVCCHNPSDNGCGRISHVLPWVWRHTNTAKRNTTYENNNGGQSGSPPLDCRNMQLNYSGAGRLSVCCQNNASNSAMNSQQQAFMFGQAIKQEESESFMWREPSGRRMTDRYVRDHLEEIPRRLCDRLSLERMQRVAPSSPSSLKLDPSVGVSAQVGDLFPSLGCRTANPLHFFSIDQQNHWMFSDVLGVSASGPSVVLVDKEKEEHFVMKGNITLLKTLSFIVDFELGLLKRHQNTHSFDVTGCSVENSVCVRELNTSSFNEVVMEDGKDVVLLVYAHWCGFCQTFSHTFLSLAQYFSPSNITFARINGALNDLPWQLTFSSYPVVIIFPAKKKADSVVFSPQQDRRLPSLVSFVLRNVEDSTRLNHAADVCSHNCVLHNLRRGRVLQQELQRKSGRLQSKLQKITLDLGSSCKDDSTSSSITFNNIDSNYREKDSQNIPNKPFENSGAGVVSKQHYSCLSKNYLQRRLQEIRQKMNTLEKFVSFLQDSEDTIISKIHLLSLISKS